MHTFTKQQRQGGAKYQPRTLVGNWSEEVNLQRSALQEFLQQKQAGALKVDRFQERMRVALAEVEMTKIRDDPYVHFGDVLQLVHVDTGAVLSVDVEDKDPCPGELSCAACASTELRVPLARNTLLIAKYVPSQSTPLDPQWSDDVLHYGQKMRLLANPMAQAEPLDAAGGEQPLALYSRPISVNCAARYSRHQLVAYTWKPTSYDSVWQVQPIDPADRLAAEGVEVAAGAPLLLVHCATQKPLNVEICVTHPDDFGIELEVSAHAVMTSGKQLALEHALRGETKRTLPKPQLSSNHWMFVTGSLVATLPPGTQAAVEQLERLIGPLQQQMQQLSGETAATGLCRTSAGTSLMQPGVPESSKMSLQARNHICARMPAAVAAAAAAVRPSCKAHG
eukprot:GHRR01022780.1.p1 GENE.GHRR01022780.1~~GHRR01022780.1.p1  ORF type:complete len:394 (+),score=136.20 GHRR01022780.1:107-1288(+)